MYSIKLIYLKVFRYDGLLLCVTRDSIRLVVWDNTRLVVWSLYTGITMWINLETDRLDKCAIGYDKNFNHNVIDSFFL